MSEAPQRDAVGWLPLPLASRQAATSERLRVGLVSLGCPKNLVDGEVMLGALQRRGH